MKRHSALIIKGYKNCALEVLRKLTNISIKCLLTPNHHDSNKVKKNLLGKIPVFIGNVHYKFFAFGFSKRFR